MKKFMVLMTIGAFLFSGALFHSCKKDEQMKEMKTTENLMLKVTSDFDLPIIMANESAIGYAELTHDPATNLITMAVTLDNLGDWEATEAHFYAGPTETIPPYGPGLFPEHWYMGDAYPISFSVEGPDWECPGFTWYYALHLELRMWVGQDPETLEDIYEYETAWVLVSEDDGGEFWYNKNGKKTLGWGMYFPWEFDYTPYHSNLTLSVSADEMETWTDLVYDTENDWFDMCLNGDPLTYFYFDSFFDVTVPLEVDYMNEFYLDVVTDEAFWDYWELERNVYDGCPGTWEPIMWEILNGTPGYPILYLKWDGSDYKVIDGLQYQLYLLEVPGYTGEEILRMNGDYPTGVYGYTGYLKGEYCDGDPFTITLNVTLCE